MYHAYQKRMEIYFLFVPPTITPNHRFEHFTGSYEIPYINEILMHVFNPQRPFEDARIIFHIFFYNKSVSFFQHF